MRFFGDLVFFVLVLLFLKPPDAGNEFISAASHNQSWYEWDAALVDATCGGDQNQSRVKETYAIE